MHIIHTPIHILRVSVYMATLLMVIASLTLVTCQLNQKTDLDMVYSINIDDNNFMD